MFNLFVNHSKKSKEFPKFNFFSKIYIFFYRLLPTSGSHRRLGLYKLARLLAHLFWPAGTIFLKNTLKKSLFAPSNEIFFYNFFPLIFQFRYDFKLSKLKFTWCFLVFMIIKCCKVEFGFNKFKKILFYNEIIRKDVFILCQREYICRSRLLTWLKIPKKNSKFKKKLKNINFMLKNDFWNFFGKIECHIFMFYCYFLRNQ